MREDGRCRGHRAQALRAGDSQAEKSEVRVPVSPKTQPMLRHLAQAAAARRLAACVAHPDASTLRGARDVGGCTAVTRSRPTRHEADSTLGRDHDQRLGRSRGRARLDAAEKSRLGWDGEPRPSPRLELPLCPSPKQATNPNQCPSGRSSRSHSGIQAWLATTMGWRLCRVVTVVARLRPRRWRGTNLSVQIFGVSQGRCVGVCQLWRTIAQLQ